MKPVGPISRGTDHIAGAIAVSACEHGMVAAFMGASGLVGILPHYDPEYPIYLDRHSGSLVGVYKVGPLGGELWLPSQALISSIRDDLEHLAKILVLIPPEKA